MHIIRTARIEYVGKSQSCMVVAGGGGGTGGGGVAIASILEQAESLDLDLIGIPLHKGLSLADRLATALKKLVLIEPADAATAAVRVQIIRNARV